MTVLQSEPPRAKEGERFYATVEDAGHNRVRLLMEFDRGGRRAVLAPKAVTRGFQAWVARQFAEKNGFAKVTWMGPSDVPKRP